MPVAATLFGFGIFAVMGLSPFKGSFSKFMILYAAIEQGHWAIAVVGTVATVVAAAYYLILVQRVCLEPERRPVELAPAPAGLLPIAGVLAAVTAVLGLWPEPLVEASVHLTRTLDVAGRSTDPEADEEVTDLGDGGEEDDPTQRGEGEERGDFAEEEEDRAHPGQAQRIDRR